MTVGISTLPIPVLAFGYGFIANCHTLYPFAYSMTIALARFAVLLSTISGGFEHPPERTVFARIPEFFCVTLLIKE